MVRVSALTGILLASAASLALAGAADAAPICKTDGYKAAQGLAFIAEGEALVVTWAGDPGQEGRLRLAVRNGQPVIEDLSLRKTGGAWTSLAANVTPDFSVTTGLRRMSNQQMQPLADLKIPLTQDVLDKYRWDPFWDAPLDLAPKSRLGNPPPVAGVPGTDQPGLPRDPKEIAQADAVYAINGCSVTTNGGRLEINFPGVTLGLFKGSLQYTVYRGSNLIRQEVLASTDAKWVAYKYDAGLKGLKVSPGSNIAWRDVGGVWQSDAFGGAASPLRVPLRAANRVAVAQTGAGRIAAFPPPHKFFWSREVAINMGYNWYRKDSAGAFSFGIRQHDKEDESEDPANWALYSARPGTQQLMPVYLYPSLSDAQATTKQVLTYTHGDTYKPLAGYKVMNHHYHMDVGERWLKEGVETKLPDLEVLKSLGLNIISPIASTFMVGFSGATPDAPPEIAAKAAAESKPRVADPLAVIDAGVKGARIHSDKDFLIMSNQELYNGPLGGHTDMLFSHPVYWDQRKPGQPFTEQNPKYGKVYHIGSAQDFIAMARAEDVMLSMPHPRSKGSTGYPDAIKDRDYFLDPHFQGIGLRWGMGLDGSERRTCEYRCLPLIDDMSNWMADRPEPLKYITSISEVRHQSPGDDVYASSPVTYVKLNETPDNAAPVVAALMRGDSFVTTGEVLIKSLNVEENGKNSRVVADLEWTFPLDMVEIVWGDGKKTGRKVVSATEFGPFGSHRFEIPFDATGQKWIRFAAWDSASEGALSQPMRIGKRPVAKK
jgi:hypothetical protein